MPLVLQKAVSTEDAVHTMPVAKAADESEAHLNAVCLVVCSLPALAELDQLQTTFQVLNALVRPAGCKVAQKV